MVVVSGDEGERQTRGQESEEEGSLLVDESGDSDMEGVGWAAGGKIETEGFSDGRGEGAWGEGLATGQGEGRGMGEGETGAGEWSGRGWAE